MNAWTRYIYIYIYIYIYQIDINILSLMVSDLNNIIMMYH